MSVAADTLVIAEYYSDLCGAAASNLILAQVHQCNITCATGAHPPNLISYICI